MGNTTAEKHPPKRTRKSIPAMAVMTAIAGIFFRRKKIIFFFKKKKKLLFFLKKKIFFIFSFIEKKPSLSEREGTFFDHKKKFWKINFPEVRLRTVLTQKFFRYPRELNTISESYEERSESKFRANRQKVTRPENLTEIR